MFFRMSGKASPLEICFFLLSELKVDLEWIDRIFSPLINSLVVSVAVSQFSTIMAALSTSFDGAAKCRDDVTTIAASDFHCGLCAAIFQTAKDRTGCCLE